MALDGRPAVLFLHPSDELYGADRQLLALVRASAPLVRPIVVLPDDLPYAGALSARLREEGVTVESGALPVLRRRYGGFTAMPAWVIRAVRGTWWLARLARRHRARLVVSNSAAIPVGPVVARLLGVRHIWLVREILIEPRYFRLVVRHMARIASGTVLGVSRAVTGWLGEMGRRGPGVLHDGVAVEGTPVPLAGAPRAVFVGRMSDWKGWDVFAVAARLARDRVPEARFVLAGGVVPGASPDEAQVRETVASVDPSGSWLSWVGEVPDGRVVMADAWVVVVPSRRPDPFPNVVLEAMAQGRAVVGSDDGGIREMVVPGETGLLVPPGDEHALAEALATLLADRGRCTAMGRAGQERARAEYSLERFGRRWSKVLDEHLARLGR
jgi:glycosyltransferase involved in cell wall biosynthesis